MNAYELADYVADNGYIGTGTTHEVANMLRQQADQIAELEKEKKTEPFIWLKQDFDGEWIEVFPNKGIPLYTTPQTKPLSDEEIGEIYWNLYADDWTEEDIKFARAIEERHGIK